MRAMSLRTARSRPWLSSWPVAAWKRRLNSSSLASRSFVDELVVGQVAQLGDVLG
jgi:hypothetical protein